jgi:hypothetical protein
MLQKFSKFGCIYKNNFFLGTFKETIYINLSIHPPDMCCTSAAYLGNGFYLQELTFYGISECHTKYATSNLGLILH